MDAPLILWGILTGLVSWIFYWAYRKTKYFEERGVPFKKPILFFGNSLTAFIERKTHWELVSELCHNEFKDVPIFGVFQFTNPVFMVKDIELINRIFVKDFHHFVDHGLEMDDNVNPIESNLFNMSGNRWRAFRHKFSPMFTSGKLKNMTKEMFVLTESMIRILEKNNLKKEVDLRESFSQLAMDIIGSCGYGLDTHNLGNENSDYRKMGKKMFSVDVKRFIKISFMFAFPKLAKNLGFAFNDRKILEYFRDIVEDTLEYRMKGGYQRNDFVHLMLTLKEKGSIEITSRDESDDYLNLDSNENYSTEKFDLGYDKIVGNAVSFLTLGFEATAITMLYLCYDLAKNQEIQDRLRKEINAAIDGNGGQLTYDAIKNMPYLEMCLKESQRIHTLATEIFRTCTQKYTFPGTNITVQPGDNVRIPAQAVHLNPDIFPEPTRFNPERFAEDSSLPPGAFIPFGDGPRMCIAMRFALLEVKIATALLIRQYRVTLSPKTKPLKNSLMNFMPTPKDPLYFDLENVRN